MLKTVLNTNIIPHIWKLANIVPIPKPNKDIDKGTSYRPISPYSVYVLLKYNDIYLTFTAGVVSVVMWSSFVCLGTLCGGCGDCDACAVICVGCEYAERV